MNINRKQALLNERYAEATAALKRIAADKVFPWYVKVPAVCNVICDLQTVNSVVRVDPHDVLDLTNYGYEAPEPVVCEVK